MWRDVRVTPKIGAFNSLRCRVQIDARSQPHLWQVSTSRRCRADARSTTRRSASGKLRRSGILSLTDTTIRNHDVSQQSRFYPWLPDFRPFGAILLVCTVRIGAAGGTLHPRSRICRCRSSAADERRARARRRSRMPPCLSAPATLLYPRFLL
jgi:hypothetical protein